MKIHAIIIVLVAAFALDAHADGVQVLNADAHFPEGPIWYHGKLYYVEYDRNSVTTWDGSKNAIFWSQKGCGPSAVIPTAQGEFLTTCGSGGTADALASGASWSNPVGVQIPPSAPAPIQLSVCGDTWRVSLSSHRRALAVRSP